VWQNATRKEVHMAGSRGRNRSPDEEREERDLGVIETGPDQTESAGGARLSFRVDPAIKSLIERAARYSGETVTSYAISALVRDARQVVQAHELTVLSDRDRDRFLALLDNPPEPNEALRRAAGRYHELAVQREPRRKRA
jgi:uncharacterized protein (DUF1778 family)